MNKDNEKRENLPIHKWAMEDRPREKLLNRNAASLSDAELLAIVIASGSKNRSALELARYILQSVNYNLNDLSLKSPKQLIHDYKGIGEAKAVGILASLELGKRHRYPSNIGKKSITSSKDSFEFFYADLAYIAYEKFQVLLLSTSNRIIKKVDISEGGLSGTMVDPKKIFQIALEHHASGMILAHNHPSHNLQPSPEDIFMTKKIKSGAELLDMRVLDHLILGGEQYYSFADNNKI